MQSGDAFDVAVIGAGVIGSSVAWHLAESGARVVLLDVDFEGTLSSSELNAGGVRATWNQPINIALSKASIEFFEKNALETGYRACGYLWLRSPDAWGGALRAREVQKKWGWEVEAWDVEKIQARVPFLDRLDGVAGATFSPRDGLINPNLLKLLYRGRARDAGAVVRDRHWLRAARGGANSTGESQWVLEFDVLPPQMNEDEKRALLTLSAGGRAATQTAEIRATQVVNCAGAWAAPVAEVLGYGSPCHAVRRQICLFDSRDVDLSPYGMIVDTSGVYFHPEATSGLAGFGSPAERPSYSFEYDGEAFFQDVIWPALFERSSKFEQLKHVTGWAGLYEVSPDESGVVGPAVGAPGVWEAHSFSGHGVMQSEAVGRGLAQWMREGKCSEFDLAQLSGDRFARERFVRETLVI